MRPLIIGPEERAKMKKLKDFAEEHRISVNELLDIFNKKGKPVGDRAGYSCEIPVGYRIVFCIEHQKKGWARHLSVSINPRKVGKMANPEAVKEFMTMLGFQSEGLNDHRLYIYMEDGDTIINVVEYIK